MIHTKKYEAVLFDMDGVLADTREWVFSAFEHTASTHPYILEHRALDTLIGQPLEACYVQLVSAEHAPGLTAQHRIFQRDYMHLIAEFDGIAQTLHTLREEGIKLAIVTGRTRSSALETLDRLALRSYFDAIVTADDTQSHKPDPEPALSALRLLNVPADRALMVGDAVADILCGQRAGCETAAALYGFVGPSLASLGPTYLLETPQDILTVCLH